MNRKISLEIIRLLLILLFAYAAMVKLIGYNKFVVQIGLSPLLPSFFHTVAWVIPVLELVIAIALLFPSLLKIGLYASLIIMILFTFYIIGIFTVADHVPCSCGGILESLSWTEHLIFNIGFVLLIIFGLLVLNKEENIREVINS